MCFLRVLPEPTCYLVTEHAVGAFLAIAVQADEGSHSKPWGLATAVRDAEPRRLTCLFLPGSDDTSWKTATRPEAVPAATRSSKQLSSFTAVMASIFP